MDDLMKCLYAFVCEKRMVSVYADPKYREASHIVDVQTEKVRRDMSREQKLELSRLLDSMNALAGIESEHLFLAALGLARELGRTVGAA